MNDPIVISNELSEDVKARLQEAQRLITVHDNFLKTMQEISGKSIIHPMDIILPVLSTLATLNDLYNTFEHEERSRKQGAHATC